MIRRTMDARFLNTVANHPDVRPWLGGVGAIDYQPLLNDSKNVALVNEHGGWLLHCLGPGRYEVHSQFLPEGRGPQIVADARAGLRWMFTATDAIEFVTKVPMANRAAAGLARAGGFREIFFRDDGAPYFSGPVSYRRLTFEDWLANDDEALAAGRWFHARLEEEKAAAGSALPAHDDDDAHDRAVGASVLMARAGNPRKAVASYNRWAIFAGYAPILLLSETPAVFDVQDAVVCLKGDEMEVLLCRVERLQQ